PVSTLRAVHREEDKTLPGRLSTPSSYDSREGPWPTADKAGLPRALWDRSDLCRIPSAVRIASILCTWDRPIPGWEFHPACGEREYSVLRPDRLHHVRRAGPKRRRRSGSKPSALVARSEILPWEQTRAKARDYIRTQT